MAKISVKQDSVSKTWYVYRDDDSNITKPIGVNLDLLAVPRPANTASTAQAPAPPPPLVTTPLFVLEAPRAGQIRLTINPGVWSGFDGSEYRQSVCNQFDSFLAQSAGFEGAQLLPGGANVIRRELAQRLPATFAESLYFHYGFFRKAGDDPQAYVDLQPGMRLRMDSAASQFIPPSLAGQDFDPLLNGYVAGGQSYFNITETAAADGSPRIGFDAFLGASLLPRAKPNRGGASGLADLAGNSHRYVRLCYPAALPSADAPGRVGSSQSITLLGADTPAALSTATQQYYQRGSVDASNEVSVAFFRGRAILIPEIPCLLNDTLVYVPLGTTYRQLLQRFVQAPRIPSVQLDAVFPFQRYFSVLKIDDEHAHLRVEQTPVDFVEVRTAGAIDCFDLPVLAVDQIKFRIS